MKLFDVVVFVVLVVVVFVCCDVVGVYLMLNGLIDVVGVMWFDGVGWYLDGVVLCGVM